MQQSVVARPRPRIFDPLPEPPARSMILIKQQTIQTEPDSYAANNPPEQGRNRYIANRQQLALQANDASLISESSSSHESVSHYSRVEISSSSSSSGMVSQFMSFFW
ncbi:MAG: hypothetical protein KF874_13300 [Rhizobiaceae bacterium]|nr:hypothetical protein [Rhizobiaceae bacterium]